MNINFYIESNKNKGVMSIVTMSNDNINLLITVFKNGKKTGSHLACQDVGLNSVQMVMNLYK